MSSVSLCLPPIAGYQRPGTKLRASKSGSIVIESVDSDRLRYLGIVLECYFRWRRMGDHLGVAEFGRVIGLPDVVENRRLVDLSDDEFLLVDQSLAKIDELHRDIIETEYDDPSPAHLKARAMGYGGPNNGAVVAKYRRDLADAECALYELLMPSIELWEASRPVRRKAS